MYDIAIAGAGIGGLTSAIALQRVGHEAVVLEQAPALRAAGAGLILQTNAMMVMDQLGLGDAIRDIGAELGGSAVMTSTGKLLQELDLGSVMAGAPPGVALHREELLPVLADAFDGEIRLEAAVHGYTQQDDQVVLEVAGSTLGARALIACDGLHSAVRRAMHGEEPLRYAGYTTWRGIADASGIDLRLTEVWGGAHRFGIVPLRNDRVYWFAVATSASGGTDGDDVGDELRARFAGWPTVVGEVLAATPNDAILRTDVFDREPITRWVDGCVALLGDAAHPMTPNLGQGAGQAVEDAAAIAYAVDATTDIARAFSLYASTRQPRANWFVQQSWRFGQMAQLENVVLRAVRDVSLQLTPTSVTRRSMRSMYTPVTRPA